MDRPHHQTDITPHKPVALVTGRFLWGTTVAASAMHRAG